MSESAASLSFGHDARVVIDGWWLPASDRTSSPYAVLATIAHNAYAGIHGPQQAIGLDEYVGTGGVGSSDVNGNFTVSGAGSLYVDLPSNFETRLAAVTAQNFPEGMGGAPGIYWYHRADLYAAFDGEPGNQSGTWSEPAEACYCGWGWACLRLEFTTCPEDALLTVTLTGKTFTETDTHYTGSGRQEEFDYSPSPFTHTYLCQLSGGIGYVYLAAPAEDVDPDLEVVERITVSGFGNGAWQLAEPRWCEDPTEGVVQQNVKVFQNYRYRDGGFSAVSGSSVRCCLQDGTETNSGKDNIVENRTVRMFDVIESENYVIDLTSAKALSIMCGDITNVCDAWTCTYSSAAATAATTDEDDNVLKTVSVVDLREITRHTEEDLEAAVRVGTYTTAPGLEYDFRARKIVGGSMQGVLVDESLRTLLRNDLGAIVWVRPGVGGEYAIHDEPTTNAAGVWRAVSGDIYASFSPDVLNDYGVSFVGEDNEIHSTGRWAAREYDFALIVPVVIVRHDVWMAPPGLIYQLRSEGKELKIYWLPFPHSAEWEGGTVVATASEDPEDLCVRGLATQPYLQLAWREGTSLKLAHTHDVGDYCVGPYTEAVGYSVMRHELVGRRWFTAGLKDGAWYICYRDAGVLPPVWLPFATGATEAKIVDSEAQEMFVCGDTQTALYAVFDGSVYRSLDGGATWASAGTYTATGWSRLCGTVIGNRLLVFGFVDGAWSCKQLVLGQTVTEAEGADGALEHTLTGVGEGYLASEMTSDADPLVVCNEADGMSTYYSKDFGENWAELT